MPNYADLPPLPAAIAEQIRPVDPAQAEPHFRDITGLGPDHPYNRWLALLTVADQIDQQLTGGTTHPVREALTAAYDLGREAAGR